jgi:prepilin signal peptidase PulO-like enzyme (type II secretory pathway)
MEQLLIYIILGVMGLMLGSFAGASVWRLRAYQLRSDKAAGEPVDEAEYKHLLPLTKATFTTDRSRCLHCDHSLAWYDLIPLISWVSLGGKCRYCRKAIGWFEPVIELGLAAFFLGSYWLWPIPLDAILMVAQFCVWLIAGVLLAILFAYDLKWFLLPNSIVFPLIGLGAVYAGLGLLGGAPVFMGLVSIAGAVVILSGLYYVLWLVSKGRWIGFGDVKLGLALALLTADWQLAFIALFAANLIGCLLVIPGMVTGKVTRTTRIPFGPLLIVGTVIAVIWGPALIQAYMTLAF